MPELDGGNGKHKSMGKDGRDIPEKRPGGRSEGQACCSGRRRRIRAKNHAAFTQAGRTARQERFSREIEALRALDGPHILKIVDFGEDEKGVPYLVTPFCVNGTLHDALRTRRSVVENLRLFAGVCDGVAQAHANGVVHRDVKRPTSSWMPRTSR